MVVIRAILIHTFLFLSVVANIAKADILFEGYYKITAQDQHIGYSISRYDFDAKTKQFTFTSYLFANGAAESTKAISNENLQPVSYQYNFLQDKYMKLIDAKFKNNKMTAKVTEGTKTKTITKDLPKGTFLSYFLAYVMLKSPLGMKVDTKYDYSAIAEEEAEIYKGLAVVKAVENYNNIKSYKILNEFKKTEFVSYASLRGDMFSAQDPKVGIKTELVSKPEEATGKLSVNKKAIDLLFGGTPSGQMNALVKPELRGQ